MNIKFQDSNMLVLSRAETFNEIKFMMLIESLVKATGSKTVEFAVKFLDGGVDGLQPTHVGLQVVIPEGFEVNEFTHEVERKPTCCQHCGGPDH